MDQATVVTGKRIRELREERSLSQSELARLARVSQAHVAKIEGGRVDPRLSTINRIMFVLTRERRTKRCRDVMNRNIVSVEPDTPVERAIGIMREFEFSQLPVFSGRANMGSVSDATIMKNFGRRIRHLRVRDIIDRPFPVVNSMDPVEILPTLLEFHPAVLVSCRGRVSGIITKWDLIGSK
jgi:predicted transcriptional regulator